MKRVGANETDQGGRAGHRRDATWTWPARRSRASSARTSSTGSTSSPWRCRRCATAPRTCRCSRSHFLRLYAGKMGKKVTGISPAGDGGAGLPPLDGQRARAGERHRARGGAHLAARWWTWRICRRSSASRRRRRRRRRGAQPRAPAVRRRPSGWRCAPSSGATSRRCWRRAGTTSPAPRAPPGVDRSQLPPPAQAVRGRPWAAAAADAEAQGRADERLTHSPEVRRPGTAPRAASLTGQRGPVRRAPGGPSLFQLPNSRSASSSARVAERAARATTSAAPSGVAAIAGPDRAARCEDGQPPDTSHRGSTLRQPTASSSQVSSRRALPAGSPPPKTTSTPRARS